MIPYHEGINQGEHYLCDRCNISELRSDEYDSNVRDVENSDEKMRYCNECSNYMVLKKWKCLVCGSTGTSRSERKVEIMHCGKLAVLE